MSGYYLIAIIVFAVSWFVQHRLKSKFKKYSKQHLENGMTGAEIARRMLADHGITDVEVISVDGKLTDHYNPAKKTVNLSQSVYNERNAAAAAVAAHEVGHAVQHAKSYSWVKMRSQMVPVVNVASRFSTWVILGGLVLSVTTMFGSTVLLIGIILYALGTVFSFVTLPVEYDASNRALAWLERENMVTSSEHDAASDALKWAARTYVVAAIGSLATLLYFVSIFLGND